MKPALSSLYQSVDIEQTPKPLMIGERCNANGSKRFRELLLKDDFEGMVKIALEQQNSGAHVLDVCTAYAGRDEKADITKFIKMLTEAVRLPLVIDSTTPDCIEAALEMYPGRCLINSINLEDGGINLNRVCPLIKRYGAAVIALTIGKDGMAMTTDEKVEIAKEIYDLAVNKHGLRPQDIFFDPLTFTIGSGDETLRDAAIQTLDAIKRIKTEIPGVFTVLGLSNISFGLPPYSRKILNSVFLHEAIEVGLDAAIVDPAKILPLAMISEEDREICMDLLLDRQKGEATPLMAFIEYFDDAEESDDAKQEDNSNTPPEEQLGNKVLHGDKDELGDILEILLQRYAPTEIINTILVPAMRHVGELFGKGEMLLPFVLQSAEVMKRSVSFLEPFMEKKDEEAGVKILLATVQGDVHDIGKNLVDIILSNNGYKVFNIGIKVPAETIIAKAKEHEVDIIGLSGLLVKSAIVMQESMAQYKESSLTCPILLGGAALTTKFVARDCAPRYDKPVVYCPDAFAGLKAVRDFEAGNLKSTEYEENPARKRKTSPSRTSAIDRTNVDVPQPPFLGAKHITDIDPQKLFKFVNEAALFRGRWGYRRGNTSAEEYKALVAEKVTPIYDELKRRAIDDNLVQPKVAYGYFKCHSQGDALIVEDNGKTFTFDFPRGQEPPYLCMADFFKTKEEGGDIVVFYVGTIGSAIDREIHRLYENDEYHDYLMLHGFSVEVADALAEYWHEIIRQELGIATPPSDDINDYANQKYRGSRYGFGYCACPDLGAHKPVFELLQPEKIGVILTENMQLVPEQSTSAIIVHHPQAKYFTI